MLTELALNVQIPAVVSGAVDALIAIEPMGSMAVAAGDVQPIIVNVGAKARKRANQHKIKMEDRSRFLNECIARLRLSPRVMMSTAQQPKLPKPHRFVFMRLFPVLGFAAAPWRAAASACLAHSTSSSASS